MDIVMMILKLCKEDFYALACSRLVKQRVCFENSMTGFRNIRPRFYVYLCVITYNACRFLTGIWKYWYDVYIETLQKKSVKMTSWMTHGNGHIRIIASFKLQYKTNVLHWCFMLQVPYPSTPLLPNCIIKQLPGQGGFYTVSSTLNIGFS